MAAEYFPSTKNFVPTFYFPEYDPPESKRVSLFNRETQSKALRDPTGIFPGRNYGSFTDLFTCKLSNEIYAALVEKRRTLEGEVSQMLVYDFYGHFAGLPLVFLKYKGVGMYVSFQVTNDQARDQLIRNAKVYGFASKLIVLSDLVEPRVVEDGAICILPRELVSLGMSAYDFVSFNRGKIYIAVVPESAGDPPKSFKKEKYKGFVFWVSESLQVEDESANNSRIIDTLRSRTTSLASHARTSVYTPSFYEDSNVVQEIPLDEIPILKFPTDKLITRDFDIAGLLTSEWMCQFKEFILDVLEQLRDPKRINFKTKDLLTDEYVKKYWLRAFVHETVNAENNLESLETIGDSTLNFAVKQMLYNNSHKFKADQLTNLYKKLTSKKIFGGYSRKIGLVKFAVMMPGVDMTVSIAEDILEAFAGAMVLAGDDHIEGLGTFLVKKLVHSLMYDDLFGSDASRENLEDDLLSDKFTLVTTDYTGFVGKGSFEGNLRTTGESAVYTSIITDRGMDNLRRLGYNPSKLLRKYVATDEDPKVARETSSELLFKDLKKIGFTYEEYEKGKRYKKWSQSPALLRSYQRAKEIASKKGYIDISVKIPVSSKTLTKMVLILVGHKPEKNYNLEVLVHQMDKGRVSESNRHLATIQLLENYIAASGGA